MSDFCGSCTYLPTKRLGPQACPYPAGYWRFLARNVERLAGNGRMRRSLQGLRRLADAGDVVAQEEQRGAGPP